jgi:ActR/RegA family two-component response regulator
MPRGGAHGGGRPKIPPEIKAKTVTYYISPILIDAIAASGENKSHLVEKALLKHFGITPLQWEIYTVWIECDRRVIAAAEKLGRDPENVRQVVAKVERKLKT